LFYSLPATPHPAPIPPTWLYERDQELSNGVGKPPVDRYLLFYRHDQVRLPPQLWIARFPLHYREPQDTP